MESFFDSECRSCSVIDDLRLWRRSRKRQSDLRMPHTCARRSRNSRYELERLRQRGTVTTRTNMQPVVELLHLSSYLRGVLFARRRLPQSLQILLYLLNAANMYGNLPDHCQRGLNAWMKYTLSRCWPAAPPHSPVMRLMPACTHREGDTRRMTTPARIRAGNPQY